jgi:2-polyprenyl-3-methyl-5-hydroxy-6-metoxy-1,4-benzoquinol methylase
MDRYNSDNNNRKKVLDVGAGIGIYSEYMLMKGYSVTALDPSPDSMKQTRAKKVYSTLDCSQLLANSQTGIHIKDVLQHIPDKDLFLSLCSNLLEVGGVIACVFREVNGIVAFRDKLDTHNRPNYFTTTISSLTLAAERSNIHKIGTYTWCPPDDEIDWYSPPVPRTVYFGVKS